MTTLISWEQIGILITAIGGFEAVKYFLNLRNNKRMAKAQASSAETDVAEKISHLYEGRLAEMHTSLASANDTICNNQQRMGDMNKTIDKLQDRIHDLTGKLWESEQAQNKLNARVVGLTQENGNLRLANEHYSQWRCEDADCIKRRPPNPSLRGQTFTKPKGFIAANPNTTDK